jgi:hypothetical protein
MSAKVDNDRDYTTVYRPCDDEDVYGASRRSNSEPIGKRCVHRKLVSFVYGFGTVLVAATYFITSSFSA